MGEMGNINLSVNEISQILLQEKRDNFEISQTQLLEKQDNFDFATSALNSASPAVKNP